MANLTRGTVTRIRLRAKYFDTPDRLLAQSGMALRLRLEGRRWIQTLKIKGEHALSRLELNHPRPTPTLDLTVYQNTPAHEALMTAQAQLSVSYETNIVRTLRRIRIPAGAVEVAFDLGDIVSGDLRLPVSEVEFELLSGRLDAVFLLGLKWQRQHGLILDLRSKAERGDRLTALARALCTDTPAGTAPLNVDDVSNRQAAAIASFWAPRPIGAVRLLTTDNTEKALINVTLECLEQIARNSAVLAEVDTARICRASTPEHVHQLRVGIRRLRSAWSLFEGLTDLPSENARDQIRQHFAALGSARDDDVLRDTLLPILKAAGQPPLEFERKVDDQGQARTVVTGSDYQSWLIEMLGWAVGVRPDTTGQAETLAGQTTGKAALKPLLRKRLFKWHGRVLRDGLQFERLPIEDKHALRKRAKRLRYGLQFAESLLPGSRLKNYRKSLSVIQEILGEMNDLYVARERFEGLKDQQPSAWFAVGWITSRLDALTAQAKKAFSALKRADHFWD